MRIVFMGTPQIAADALQALLLSGHEIAAVYTRADKPQGRKQVLTPSPVKELALKNGIDVQQPLSFRREGGDKPKNAALAKAHCSHAQILASYKPDLVVVVAYGLILTKEVLAVPRFGCINLHVSLLPKYRGSAPIQWAVINGDAQTGVSIQQMDEGLDTGDVLACEPIDIPPYATAGDMFLEASAVGAKLLVKTIAGIEAGKAVAVPQGQGASLAPQLNKSMAEIDFRRTASELHNLVRGCNPWPVAWFMHEGKRIKVNTTRVTSASGASAGEVLATEPLTIACGEGALILDSVVPEGAKPMAGSAWAAGRRFKCGDVV